MTDTDTAITDPADQPASAADSFQRIPRGLICPSPLNPRKTFNPARVADIAASMAQLGQLQPIRVRPNPQWREGRAVPRWEIVAGETRWRASEAAGLDTLDCIVREYTDSQALEVMLVENLQRSDLHPMEEAAGYERLMHAMPTDAHHAPSVAEMAARVGKSSSYVYQRLKLLALCPAGRSAFADGQINASVALLIARMPNAEEQARATAYLAAGWGGEPYSYRQAAEYLQKEFMLQLAKAPFDITATYAVAGPCTSCPKRSGAEPQLFSDVTSGDMCQDARCYQAKREQHRADVIQAARDADREVLTGPAGRKAFASRYAPGAPYLMADEACTSLTDSARPLRIILGKKRAAQITLVDTGAPEGHGQLVDMVQRGFAVQALWEQDLLRDPAAQAQKPSLNAKGADEGNAGPPAPVAQPAEPGGEGRSADEPKKQARNAPSAQAAAEESTARRRREDIEHAARAGFARDLYMAIVRAAQQAEQLPVMLLKQLALDFHAELPDQVLATVWRALGWDFGDPLVSYEGPQLRAAHHMRAAEAGPEGGRVLAEALLATWVGAHLFSPNLNPNLATLDQGALRPVAELAQHYGIDPAPIWQQAQTDSERAALDPTSAFLQQHADQAENANGSPAA